MAYSIGAWQTDDPTRIKDGHFIRPPTTYRNFVTADGSPGPTGQGGFPAEAGRYHLYVSLACPWAHRTLIFRRLKKLEEVISVSVVEPVLGNRGWEFGTGPGATLDTVNGKLTLAEIYILTDPHYTGRVTVPVLWDRNRRAIVNNELSEIIRMLNSALRFRSAQIIIRPSCEPTLIASMMSFTRPLTMVFTTPASPPSRGPMKKRHARCLLLSTSSKIGCSGNVI